MKWTDLAAATAAAAIFTTSTTAQELTAERIDAAARETIEAFDIPGMAVSVVRGGDVIFTQTYGVRDVRAPEVPVDENTIFPFASVGKAFTTAALAMLVDEGKLNWDDPVRRFIPEFEMSDPYITEHFSVRDLVTHRSGLPLGAGDLLVFPDADPEVSDILAAIRNIPPETSFRAEYAYDNLMYVIAGEVAARAAGKPWHEVIEDRIFEPLGMESCQALPSEAAADDNTVTQHSRAPGETEATPIDPRYIVGDNTAPAGGLSCSIADLSTWAQFWLNEGVGPDGERLLSQEQVEELWSPVTPQTVSPLLEQLSGTHFSLYALGWSLRDFHGEFFVGHSGGLLGAASYFGLLPDQDLAVFVTSNISTYGSSALALQLLSDAAAPEAESDWLGTLHGAYLASQETAIRDSGSGDEPDVAIDPVRDLEAYAGEYVDPWYGLVTVEIRDGGLFLDMSRSEVLDAPLVAVAPDRFVARWPDRSLNADAFVDFTAEDGQVVGMTMEPVSETTDFSFDFHDLDFTKRD
ncbi:serine hydrolase [Marinicauda pacifica]|jgi:CubicO group peptidase (beta-lactamase class C family)|uniref:serine hydrolase n=1 Tax=Marinicauda pacifica TaxID=1133559 RepID=UPI0035C79288